MGLIFEGDSLVRIFFKVIIVSVLALASNSSFAFDQINTGYLSDLTLEGYDTTSYHTKGEPIEGSSKYKFNWNGAEWHFLRAEDRDLFAANPESFAPQYGGYCSNQMSLGNLSDTDPNVWLIHEGKLYLFGHDVGRDRWANTGVADRIKEADKHWKEFMKQ